MSSAEVVKPLSNEENGSFKENSSNQYRCPNMKTKCYRKGSRICYTDLENITMLKKIPEKDTSQISIADQPEKEIYDKVDSYRSGESLFKTFTFEQTRGINDPETVKCIEFWKGVMQKNLAPIKCTLIESDKKKSHKGTEERKKSLTESKKLSISEKSMEGGAEKIIDDFAADQEKIWSQALKEIRNRKLDKLKLYVKDRCEYCRDPFTKRFADEMRNENEQAAQIEALNNWEPKDESKNRNQSKLSLMKRFHSKLRRISSTQTENREKANKFTENAVNSKRRSSSISKHSDLKLVANSKLVSNTNLESSGHFSPMSTQMSQTVEYKNPADDTTKTANSLKITEVQVPDIKCPCESDTCVCPHRAAAKKSRTSLVEIARQNMPEEDKSAENILPSYDDTCICKRKTHPWETTTCSTEPCVGKQPDIQESSSDFNLNRLLEKMDRAPTCICENLTDVVCASEECKNKNSKDSLLDIQPKKDSKENSCACSNANTEVPCTNEACSTKSPKRTSGKCLCRSEKPWCEIKCQSWSCSINNNKIRRKQKYDREEIKSEKLTTVKEVTSTCVCDTQFPWKKVECVCEECTRKQKQAPTRHVEEKKRRSSMNIKKTLSRTNPKIKETNPQKISQNKNKCICSLSEPWCPVTCATYCDTKEKFDKSQEKVPTSIILNKSEEHQEDSTCICEDKTLEPTCKAFKCKNRDFEVDYPPPCICPKDLEESKHEHFTCDSEKCKMKKIDQTCICSTMPEVPCENKTCVTKPPASKTLKYSHKKLNYDTKCICKVRGFSTTADVNCTASHCPFRKKPVLPKKTPITVTNIPHEDTSNQNIPTNKSKCLCKTADTICENPLCRAKKKPKRNSSIGDESGEDEEPESCICNDDIDSGQEVICRQVQCRKVSITEGGVVMNDKCVCATMDSPCNEPSCHKMTDKKADENFIEETTKIERPYCYICGHYDCSSNRNKSEGEEVCGKNSSSNDNI